VGGGISGLAAAWGARDESPAGLEVIVLEREGEVGGKAVTLERDGWLLEAGPTGYLGGEPVLDRLVEAAGLEAERVPAREAAARRFIVRGGRPREVRPHPVGFLRSGLLGPLGILRLACEPLVPPRRDGDEESVWQFARRRIGRQAADRLIAPMVLGVFAGDAHRLSLPASFPRLAEIEREHGSLVRGLLARRRRSRSAGPGEKQAVGGPAGPAGGLHSFHRGLQSLPRALADRGTFEVRCGVEARRVVEATGGGWRVETSQRGEALEADAVVLAGEPWAMAELVRSSAPGVARRLEEIPCPPVAVVALGYRAHDAASVPRGFGVLVPRGEGYRILGCLWDTYLFAGRSPEGTVLLRAMVGGSTDPEAAGLADGRLLDLVRAELGRLLGVRGRPVLEEIVRWPRAIPQYEIGHPARVRALEEELERLPGLLVAGNALHGIAFSRAASAGFERGKRAARLMAGRPSVRAG
jgi:oxygen-dependent protoporphyrinogen oxidase